jgi:propionate CoA-transferase
MQVSDTSSMFIPLRSPDSGKIASAEEAARLVRDGDTVATGGFVGIGFAEEIAVALEALYLSKDEEIEATGKPRNLTLIYAAGQGDGKERGLNHFGHEGLVRRVIGGHWGLVPKLQRLAIANRIEAYNFPQGVISHLFRDTAAKRPGHLTRVGLGTFVDPRHGGGKINECTKDDLVSLLEINGEEFLFYRTLPIDVGIVRGTTADPDGNITMEKEALTLEVLAIAMAARNSGGLVIAQVERIADRGSLNPRQVKIPGVFVDCVVLAKPEHHWQTFAVEYDPTFSGEIRARTGTIPPMELTERKIIARRAALELKANSVVNLGIGMPEGLANVANEEKIVDLMTMTAEPGVIGGYRPADSISAQRSTHRPSSISPTSSISMMGRARRAFLGLAQADRQGNLNVSKFGPRLAGAGGFINISQNAKKVVFVGTFTAGGLQIAIEDGRLRIINDGGVHKFVRDVEHRTFSGDYAVKRHQPVFYVTERCVFELTPEGLALVEVAPGIDIEREILARMDFKPIIRRDPALMDQRIFLPASMGLRDDLLRMPLEQRFTLHPEQNQFFVNFEGHVVRNHRDIEQIRRIVESMLSSVGRRVHVIVNYDNFNFPRRRRRLLSDGTRTF